MIVIFICFICVMGIDSITLPSYIKRCSKSSPNFNKCLDKSITETFKTLKEGNKDLGVVQLEPFYIKKLELGNISSGIASLQEVFENMKIFGLSNTSILDSDANLTGNTCYWNYKSKAPTIRIESDYSMQGQFLIFPINGFGKSIIYLYDVDGKFEAKCERYTKKNKIHIRVNEFIFYIKPKKVVFNFENIINGNEQLSKEVVKTINENSEIVYADVGPALNEVMGSVWKQTLNRVFSRIPENDLFLA